MIFQRTYRLLQQLTPDGMRELEGFTWHAKGHRMYESIDGKNTSASPIYHARYGNIPAALQTQLASQKDFPEHLYAAHTALKDILVVAKEERVKIMQSAIAASLKLVPRIAQILAEKSIYVKLDSWPETISNASFRIRLLYNDFPVESGQQFYWARRVMFDKFQASIAELFVSPGLIERVKYQLPDMQCFAKEPCFGIVRQEHNINEYARALTALAQGLPMPTLNFRQTLPMYTKLPDSMQSLVKNYVLQPEETVIPAVVGCVGLSVMLLAGRYVVKSCYRQYSFWRQSWQGEAQQPLSRANITYQPLPTQRR